MASSRALHAASTLRKLLCSPPPLPALAAARRRLSTVNAAPVETDRKPGYVSGSYSELDPSTPAKPSLLLKGCEWGFVYKVSEDAATLRMDMPGMQKQDLKLWFENFLLNVKGTVRDDDFGIERKYDGAVEIPMGLLKLLKFQEIKAELKEGVLKVVIPKLKLEERSDVCVIDIN